MLSKSVLQQNCFKGNFDNLNKQNPHENILFSQDGLLAHPQGSLHKQSLRGECAETICQNYQLSTSKSMFTFVDLHLQGDLPVSWRLNGLHFLFGHQDGADHVQASPIDIFANLSPRLHGFLIFFILHQLHSVGYSDELAGLACTIVIIVGALGTVLFGVLAQVQWRPHQLIELTFFLLSEDWQNCGDHQVVLSGSYCLRAHPLLPAAHARRGHLHLDRQRLPRPLRSRRLPPRS